MTAGMDHAMPATRRWCFVLELTLVIGALDLVAACATGQSRDPTGQEISTAVGRADSGITAGPTGGAPYGSDAHRGLDYQERRRLVEAARAAFVATTDGATAYTVVPQNIDAEPTSVSARPAGPRETRPDGSICRPIQLIVTKQGGTTMGTVTFCQAPGSSDIKLSPVSTPGAANQ